MGFACNCILNYLYSELEGKKVPTMLGPMTFGEIAYQLLNQTLVYLTIGRPPTVPASSTAGTVSLSGRSWAAEPASLQEVASLRGQLTAVSVCRARTLHDRHDVSP